MPHRGKAEPDADDFRAQGQERDLGRQRTDGAARRPDQREPGQVAPGHPGPRSDPLGRRRVRHDRQVERAHRTHHLHSTADHPRRRRRLDGRRGAAREDARRQSSTPCRCRRRSMSARARVSEIRAAARSARWRGARARAVCATFGATAAAVSARPRLPCPGWPGRRWRRWRPSSRSSIGGASSFPTSSTRWGWRSAWRPWLDSAADPAGAVAAALARAVATATIFYAFRFGYRRWRGREGMGLGDVKLAAAAGAWLDWNALPFAVEMAALGALAFVLIARFVSRRPIDAAAKLPFGAFLAPAIWVAWAAAHWRF